MLQDDIVSTSYLAAEYLHKQGFKKKAYVIGTPGVIKELDKFGIAHTDIGVSDKYYILSMFDVFTYTYIG